MECEEPPGHPREAWRQTLVEAGFADFDTVQKAHAFHEIASALTHLSLDTFDDVNRLIGTKWGLAGGWVWLRVQELEENGYVTLTHRGVRLTNRGVRAGRALGFIGLEAT